MDNLTLNTALIVTLISIAIFVVLFLSIFSHTTVGAKVSGGSNFYSDTDDILWTPWSARGIDRDAISVVPPSWSLRGPLFENQLRVSRLQRYLMMENVFDTAVLFVTLTSVAGSLILFWTLLSGYINTVAVELFDKSKLKFTDGDNT